MPDEPGRANPLTAKANFSLPVGGGFLHASAHLPTGQTTLTELLPILQNLENAIGGRIEAEAREAGSPISCKAGCGACCRQMVPVSLFEAEALMSWIRSLDQEHHAEIERRFDRALKGLREAGLLDRLVKEEWASEEVRATQLAIDYFRAHVACPFLVEESCSIHPIRPLSCREYLVTSSPDLCRDPAENEVRGVEFPIKLSNVLYQFGREIERDPRGWIPLVFLLAWGKSGSRPGDWVAGTGEEVMRKFLEQVSAVAKRLAEQSD